MTSRHATVEDPPRLRGRPRRLHPRHLHAGAAPAARVARDAERADPRRRSHRRGGLRGTGGPPRAARDRRAAAVALTPARRTSSRSTSTPAPAPRPARGAATRAAARGAPELLYVKLDSLLRGHLGAAIDGALDASGAELALVAPAFPAQGRTTAGGVQHAGGEPVADLVARLREQSARPVEAIGRDVGRLERTGLLVCDAEDDADLARIVAAGRAAGRPLVWAGSAGLAAALFDGLRGHGPSPPAPGARRARRARRLRLRRAGRARAARRAAGAGPAPSPSPSTPRRRTRAPAASAVTRGDDAVVHLAGPGRWPRWPRPPRSPPSTPPGSC